MPTIMTPALRAALDAALREDIENDTRTAVGSCGYLNDLENSADGEPVSDDMLDVMAYFLIEA